MMKITSRKLDPSNIDLLIRTLLPAQGSVEIQRDAPMKEHAWHKHPTDETIVLVEGSLRFFYHAGERICLPGDVIDLPAGTLHGSQAQNDGAVYLIAFDAVNI